MQKTKLSWFLKLMLLLSLAFLYIPLVSFSINAPYHLVEKPPQTVTSLDSLKE